MNDFGLLIGRYLANPGAMTDLELRELLLDSTGRQIISGRFLEDESHGNGDPGLFMLAVRNDTEGSLVDADGDYAPLQVDANGRLRVVADIDVSNGHEKEEDSAHQDEDVGSYILAVRSDSRPTNANTDADGDYASVFVNTNGELYVHDTDVLSKLTEIDTELDNQGLTLDSIDTSIGNIETDIDDLKQQEDEAHSSGHYGIMPLAVRADSDGSLVDTDGDYAPLQVDANGFLKITGNISTSIEGTEAYNATDNLAAGGDGEVGSIGGTFVDLCAVAVGAGETAHVYGWQCDLDKNGVLRLITDDGVNIVVYKVRLNSSALPGIDEHFSESGRIEIAGAAGLNIKIQAKKRGSGGGNATGTGSIHVRKV